MPFSCRCFRRERGQSTRGVEKKSANNREKKTLRTKKKISLARSPPSSFFPLFFFSSLSSNRRVATMPSRLVAKVSALATSLAPSLYATVGAVVAFLLGLRMVFGTLASCLPFGCKVCFCRRREGTVDGRKEKKRKKKKLMPSIESSPPPASISFFGVLVRVQRNIWPVFSLWVTSS